MIIIGDFNLHIDSNTDKRLLVFHIYWRIKTKTTMEKTNSKETGPLWYL